MFDFFVTADPILYESRTRTTRIHGISTNALIMTFHDKSDAERELTWNKGREEPYTHSNGYGHIAMVVDDANQRHAELVANGYAPLPVKEFKNGDVLLARFFFITDPDGYKIEVLEKHGHYR